MNERPKPGSGWDGLNDRLWVNSFQTSVRSASFEYLMKQDGQHRLAKRARRDRLVPNAVLRG